VENWIAEKEALELMGWRNLAETTTAMVVECSK